MPISSSSTKARSLRVTAPSQNTLRSRTVTEATPNYFVVSTTNLLEPSPGSFVSREEIQTLIDSGIKVVVGTNPRDKR